MLDDQHTFTEKSEAFGLEYKVLKFEINTLWMDENFKIKIVLW